MLLSEKNANRFESTKLIASTPYANLYYAFDSLQFFEPCVIKVFNLCLPANACDHWSQALDEELALRKVLKHTTLIPALDSGLIDSSLFISMPYIEGPSLDAFAKTESELGAERLKQILIALGEALSEMNKNGLHHGHLDFRAIILNPSGVMLGGQHAQTIYRAYNDLVQLTPYFGNPYFQAPEQLLHGNSDSRSDQYSLALIAAELLANKPLFAGRNSMEAVNTRLRHSPAEFIPKDIGSANRSALLTALDPDPLKRHSDISIFINTLFSESAVPLSVPPPQRAAKPSPVTNDSAEKNSKQLTSPASSRSPHEAHSSQIAVLEFLDPQHRGMQMPLEALLYLIGTRSDCSIKFQDVGPPRVYATLAREGRGWILTSGDPYSVQVNDATLVEMERGILETGDILQVGSLRLRFKQNTTPTERARTSSPALVSKPRRFRLSLANMLYGLTLVFVSVFIFRQCAPENPLSKRMDRVAGAKDLLNTEISAELAAPATTLEVDESTPNSYITSEPPPSQSTNLTPIESTGAITQQNVDETLSNNLESEVELLLASAIRHKDARNYVDSEKESAFSLIKRVLILDRNNKYAKTLLHDIAAELVFEGDLAKSKRDFTAMEAAYVKALALGVSPEYIKNKRESAALIKSSRAAIIYFDRKPTVSVPNEANDTQLFLSSERIEEQVKTYKLRAAEAANRSARAIEPKVSKPQ